MYLANVVILVLLDVVLDLAVVNLVLPSGL